MKKVSNGVFIGVVLLILSAGLIKTVFFPKTFNFYENRYANRLCLPT